MSKYPDLQTNWYHTVNTEKPVPAEQITDRLIILRKNIVKTTDDGGNIVYSYDERVIGVEEWDSYQDIWNNTDCIIVIDGAIIDTFDAVDANTTMIEDCNNAIMELYEMIAPEEEE